LFDILYIEHFIGENEYFMRTKVVIRNKFRFGIALLFLIIFVVMALMISIGEGKGIDKEKDINWIFVKVKEGDLLWTISKDFVDESVDIRDYISFIRKVNKLEKAMVYPGQVLKFVDVKTYKLLCER
jgi:hypothetical protein